MHSHFQPGSIRLLSILLSCECTPHVRSRYSPLAPLHPSNSNFTRNNRNFKMVEIAPNSDKIEATTSKENLQTPTSTQISDSSLLTVPRMATPEADSMIARFLTERISDLTSLSPLPPSTPTGPNAMSQPMKYSAAASRSTPATSLGLKTKTKTRSPAGLISQKQGFESRSSQQFGSFTPSTKRHRSWSRERQESPCPEGTRKKSRVAWDHWSPGTKSRRDLFDDSPKGYRNVHSATLSRVGGNGSLRKKFLERQEDTTRQTKRIKDARLDINPEAKTRAGKDAKEKPISCPKAVKPSPKRKTYPDLLLLIV